MTDKNYENIRKAALINAESDALFISNQANVSYLTSFRGLAPNERECFLFLTGKASYLLTFPTYYDLFRNKKDRFIVLNITAHKSLSNHINDIIMKQNIRNIAVESADMTLSEYERFRKKIPANLVKTENIIENFRKIKHTEEIASIRKAAAVTDAVFKHILGCIHPGVTEIELAAEIEYFLKKRGAGNAFSPIVAFGKSSAIPHYLPSRMKLTGTPTVILFDLGAKLDNYCSDMTRMVFYGTPDDNTVHAYNTVLAAQNRAIELIVPGISGETADSIARKHIISEGFEPYQHGLGHGVGIDIHELPKLKLNSQDILTENMVFTVEPGVYLPDVFGIRIEDTVVLGKNGTELLTLTDKKMILLH